MRTLADTTPPCESHGPAGLRCSFLKGHSGDCYFTKLPDGWAPQLGDSLVRQFSTGATRSQDLVRDDPEGYLSPLVEERFCEYMTLHRTQPDGSIRDSDNWQKGMPLPTYMKGIKRHQLHLWLRHRGFPVKDPLAAPDIESDLCAIIFNAQGYLHELLKAKLNAPQP